MLVKSLILTNCILTAYYNPTHNLDSSGHYPVAGITIASARRDIQLGSRVIINGHIYKLTDHMNKRFNGQNRFDIFMNSREECIRFGIKTNITLTVVETN